MPEAAKLGHNHPPEPPTTEEVAAYLRDQFAPLTKRAEALAGSVDRFLTTHPEIKTDEAQGIAAEVVRQVKAHGRLIEGAREEAKRPYLEAGRTVDGWFKALAGKLAKLSAVERAMTAYARKVEEDRRRAAEEEAKNVAAEAARQAALAAVAANERAAETARVAAGRAVEAAAAAEAKPADLTRVHGEFGAVASLAETWDFEVVNIAEVPVIYLQIDTSAVRRAIGHDKIRDIPGLRIFSVTSVRVR